MSSGVQVSDGVKELFSKMKVMKKDDDEGERLRYALFIIEDGAIIVDKVVQEKDLEGVENHFQHFRRMLDDKKCYYVLYDCHYENEECSKKEDLIFFMWAPDNADVKEKMAYASSKCPLARVFTGVKYVKQINDPGEYQLEYFADLLGKNTVTIEGCCVKSSHKKGH